MALVSGVSRTGEKAILLILALSILGLLRFSVAALKEIAKVPWVPPRVAWFLFAGLIGASVWFSAHPDRRWIDPVFERTTEILTAVAAILTVDALLCRKLHPPRAFDWPATLSLACAIGIPMSIRFWEPQIEDQYRHPWLLPSYTIAFGAHMLARGVERVALTTTTPRRKPGELRR